MGIVNNKMVELARMIPDNPRFKCSVKKILSGIVRPAVKIEVII